MAPGSHNALLMSEQTEELMDLSRVHRISNWQWRLDPEGGMHVPAVLYGNEGLIAEMDDKVLEQIGNVACLPGIVDAAYTMPDAHWGYGFPIGGVAAFDPDEGGVVSAGGVGFDISCGVRTLLTGLKRQDLEPCKEALAHSLSRTIPAGVGSTGKIVLDEIEMDRMLEGGALIGPSGKATAAPRTSTGSRSVAASRAPGLRRCRIVRGTASARRWARWARATIISKCKR
jgi:hypothetical protein